MERVLESHVTFCESLELSIFPNWVYWKRTVVTENETYIDTVVVGQVVSNGPEAAVAYLARGPRFFSLSRFFELNTSRFSSLRFGNVGECSEESRGDCGETARFVRALVGPKSRGDSSCPLFQIDTVSLVS